MRCRVRRHESGPVQIDGTGEELALSSVGRGAPVSSARAACFAVERLVGPYDLSPQHAYQAVRPRGQPASIAHANPRFVL